MAINSGAEVGIDFWNTSGTPGPVQVTPATPLPVTQGGSEQNSSSGTTARKATREQWFYSIFTGTATTDLAVSSGVPAVLRRIRNVGTAATTGTLRISDGASTATVTNGQTSYPPTTGGSFMIVPAAVAVNADAALFDGLVCATSLVIQASVVGDIWLVEWMPL